MKFFTSHRWIALLMGLILLAWSYCPGSLRLEDNVYSVLMSLVPESSIPGKTVVVMLGTGDKNTPAAISYARLADLLRRLEMAGSKAIGLDLPLDHSQTELDDVTLEAVKGTLKANKRDKSFDYEEVIRQLDPDGDLHEALTSAHNIVLGISNVMSGDLPDLAIEPPDNRLAALMPLIASPAPVYYPGVTLLAKFSGLVPMAIQLRENNGVLASIPLAIPFGERYLPSFELLLATRALGVSADSLTVYPGKGLRLGSAWYGSDAGLRIYPERSVTSVPVLSADELLAGRQLATKYRKKLRGKTVLVGLETGQMVRLPGSRTVSRLEGTAQAVNALMNEALVRVPNWSLGLQRGAMLLILVYLVLAPVRMRGLAGLAGALVLAFLILNGSLLLLILKNTWIPMGLPVLLLLSGQAMVWVHHRFAHSFSRVRGERDRVLVELAEQLRSQGKVDKAFDHLQACAKGDLVMDGLYQVGLEFERRRQFGKALAAYDHIAQWNRGYRDIAERRSRHKQVQDPATFAATTISSHAITTLVVDDPVIERPVLGRYEIERELGRGAMGTVYLGRDPRIGRTVAIKTLALTEEFESTQLDEVRRRFFQEAETAGRLGHPNIVTIYDVGEEHDLAYIAMDYIQGVSLDRHVRDGALLPLKDVFTIGIQVAEALDYAHELNVVHRDVKPGNIIYDQEKGQLKVTDFGIACLTDNSKTRTGTVLGSPYYMSPEQIAGQKVDGRSDLFSLGVTLYQLFSGRLPFEGDSLTNLMYQITHEKPVSVRKVNAELPSCLTRILNKALEKKPANRYDNGQAMAEALKRCAGQSGIGFHDD